LISDYLDIEYWLFNIGYSLLNIGLFEFNLKSNIYYLISHKMKKPDYHILICNSYRVAGDAKGYCNKNGGAEFIQYVTEECADRGIDAAVSSTACLNVCSQGPVMVIQPNNFWYGAITTEKIDEILDALEEGNAVEEYLISE